MQQALGARNNKVFQKESELTFYLKLPGIVSILIQRIYIFNPFFVDLIFMK